ncbi:hypothetical protein QB910_000111 [Dabrowskivirus KKP3916]|uniref:Uncharacterized protein n=1 Tax=Alicyclobacillus phage KKP_3916 TaxID=3040651 RepID=A0AAT9V8K8_9CAUD|nr:hypothetical protein QB910_000111 [Alicyclobacillus phage KKP 3916]
MENLLIFKRKQYLIAKFLRDVIKEPIVTDDKLRQYGHDIQRLQEALWDVQSMLPYSEYFTGEKRIRDYPSELQAQAFFILGAIKGVPWHMLAIEHGVYVKGNKVRVGDW